MKDEYYDIIVNIMMKYGHMPRNKDGIITLSGLNYTIGPYEINFITIPICPVCYDNNKLSYMPLRDHIRIRYMDNSRFRCESVKIEDFDSFYMESLIYKLKTVYPI